MDAIVVVYSVVDIGSFKLANKIVGEIRKHSQKPVILVANKVDLARGRAVSTKGTHTILFISKTFTVFSQFLRLLWNFEQFGYQNKIFLVNGVFFLISIRNYYNLDNNARPFKNIFNI